MLRIESTYRAPATTPNGLPGPTRIPLVGQLPKFLKTPAHQVLQEFASTYGPVFQYSLGMDRVVGIAEPDLIKAILKARPHCFRRSKRLADAIEGTGFLGVFTAEGERWQGQRRLVMRGLRPQVVNASQHYVNKVVQSLATKWQQGDNGEIDVFLDLKRAASDIVVATSLGIELEQTNSNDSSLQQAIDQWFRSIGRRARLPVSVYRFVSLFRGEEDQKAIDLLRSTAESAVASAKQRMAATDGPPQNILEALIVAQREDSGAFSDSDIVGNAVTMILAGQETTASSMAWLMYYLARNSGLVDELREDVDRVMIDDDRVVDNTVFDELPKIHRLCLEVLRLKPTAPLFGLSANHDIAVAGLRLPAGQKVVLMARELVKPEADCPHISGENGSVEEHRSVNDAVEGCAFGAGPRLCPGRYLALVEMMTMAIMVVRHFDVSIAEREPPVSEGFTFAMHPRNLHFYVRPRVSGSSAKL